MKRIPRVNYLYVVDDVGQTTIGISCTGSLGSLSAVNLLVTVQLEIRDSLDIVVAEGVLCSSPQLIRGSPVAGAPVG